MDKFVSCQRLVPVFICFIFNIMVDKENNCVCPSDKSRQRFLNQIAIHVPGNWTEVLSHPAHVEGSGLIGNSILYMGGETLYLSRHMQSVIQEQNR